MAINCSPGLPIDRGDPSAANSTLPLSRVAYVEITLVSRENFFLLTPLLFEACSGRLELRHCAQPIRAALQRARFIEATVESVEVERQLVRAVAPEGGAYDVPYDHLVVGSFSSSSSRSAPDLHGV